MKCESCKAELQTTFLKKIVGTIVKDEKGKPHYFCSNCQKQLGSREKLLAKV